MRIGGVQALPERYRAGARAGGEEDRVRFARDDLFDLAREARFGRDRDRVVRKHLHARLFGFLGDERGERHLEGVLVVEHVEAPDAERAHQLRLRLRLRDVAGLQAHEVAFPARVEAPGLVLARVERRGEADIGARGADLEDARLVDDRQRDRGRGRAVVAEVGDRARVLRGLLGCGRAFARARLAVHGVHVVE